MGVLDVTTGDTSIVTGGVVSAPGYDPIIITETPENKPEPTKKYEPEEDDGTILGYDRVTFIFTSIFFGIILVVVIKACGSILTAMCTASSEPVEDRSKVYHQP